MAQINKSSEYFNTVLYTGDGTTSNAITGVGFQPDWLWIKDRDTAGNRHIITDSVTFSDRRATNTTDADETNNRVGSYDSDGFTLNSSSSQVNGSSTDYVAWNWLADNTSGSSNTDGSITSTVSASTVSGFSIVSYTGNGTYPSTIGHGLGSVPHVLLTKKRNGTLSWQVYHIGIGNTKKLQLNGTNAESTDTVWNNTTPTSSVFTVGNSDTNNSGDTFIAYCFAEKKGFSKFGSYTGNGSADGTFVYTGFKPAMVIVKRTDTTGEWVIMDNKRDTFNVLNKTLYPSTNDAEATSVDRFDFLSNGFKSRSTSGFNNASGGTYIYMAFAESPLVGTNNIPATAR